MTGAMCALHDDVLSNMLVTWETLSTPGVPVAYYTDNNPMCNPRTKKPRTGMQRLMRIRDGEEPTSGSQLQRALTELGIALINATPSQPQGKGKVERMCRFMQERLLNALITAGVQTIAEANPYLNTWVVWYKQCHLHSITKMLPNERYRRSDAFRTLPVDIDLNESLCLKDTRKVRGDHPLAFAGHT
jgi:hypothetical protein